MITEKIKKLADYQGKVADLEKAIADCTEAVRLDPDDFFRFFENH